MRHVQPLERRQLLAATDFIDGRLFIDGTDGDDEINISLNVVENVDVYIRVEINGETARLGRGDELIATNATQIDVRSFTGDDVITFAGNATPLSRPANSPVPFTEIDLAVEAGGGDDRVVRTAAAGLGNSTLIGGSGDDVLEVFTSANVLAGGRGNDKLTDGDGRDQLFGGPGDDSLAGGLGTDTLSGGTGVDNVDYAARTENLLIDLRGDDDIRVPNPSLADILFLNDPDLVVSPNRPPGRDAAYHGTGDLERDEILGDIENAIGGSGNDALIDGAGSGLDGSNILIGNAGDDLLFSTGGLDTLYGNEGTDRFFAWDSDGFPTIGTNRARDRLVGGPGNDFAQGNTIEVLVGIEREERLPFATS
ncbi:MAG: hypothetical protein AAF743_06600 [Planctomycetota bacterium]